MARPRRHKPRVADYRNVSTKGATHYIMPSEAVLKVPRRIERRIKSPPPAFYEGLADAKRSGARLSKGVCSGRAMNGTPRANEVATDWRIREMVAEDERNAKRLRLLQRKIDVALGGT